jgi:Na+-driven multidrug efflux pump
MRLVGLTMPIEALSFAFLHGLLGAGDAKGVMFVSVSIQWLRSMQLAYLVCHELAFGLLADWLQQGGTRSMKSARVVLRWKRRRWQHITV